jgi:hypothetical protein
MTNHVRVNRKQPTNEARKSAELNVTAHNSPLATKVKCMPVLILLANCHPIDRKKHAKNLYDSGLMTNEEARHYLDIREDDGE